MPSSSRSPSRERSSRRRSSRDKGRSPSDRHSSRNYYNDDERKSSRKDKDRVKESSRERDSERSRGRNSVRNKDHDKSRSRDRDGDRDNGRDRDRDRGQDRDSRRHSNRSRERSRDRGRDKDRERDRDSKSRRHRSEDSDSDSGSRGRSGRSSSHRKKSRRDDEDSSRKTRETSEERAARKAQKKKEKEEQKAVLEVAMNNYTNADNPFNDANLAQKFTWAKKREVEKKKGISSSESARRDAARREEAKIELEKLTKKRAEREREREEREEELVRIQRASEQAQLGDWQAQEEEFHLKQAKKRAEIRIKSNRAKPIDILAMNIKLISHDENMDEQEEEEDDIGLEIDVEEPYTIFDNLTLEEVEELLHDIKFYLTLDKNEQSEDFWRSMLIVCEDKLTELNPSRVDQTVVAPHIARDIASKLVGKSYEELTLLQGQIQRKLGSGGAMDVDYWEALLKTLIVWKAKARLNNIHQLILQRRLEQLKARQLREAEREMAELAAVLAMHSQDIHGDTRALGEDEDQDMEAGQEDDDQDMEPTSIVPYDRAMSPEPFDVLSGEDQGLAIVDQWEDWAEVLEKRRQVLSKQYNPKKKNATEQSTGEQHPDDEFVSKLLFDKEAAKQLAGDEELFNVEASLQRQQTYMWQDKYRPRKPRFFNRVHTGYEWNKYNQTHYDHDNPPPKVVQGYKFNLFYPDLIDKSQAPTYEIVKEPGTTDTVLIKFKAGPPYEDIAFRIVNREWEHSHKRGYKSVFDRGVLQLHFNFKRQFYRR